MQLEKLVIKLKTMSPDTFMLAWDMVSIWLWDNYVATVSQRMQQKRGKRILDQWKRNSRPSLQHFIVLFIRRIDRVNNP